MTKILNFIFGLIFGLWNPKTKRDVNGKIIDDFKRKRESKKLKKQIASGEIKLPPKEGDKPRCYKVRKDGQIIVTK